MLAGVIRALAAIVIALYALAALVQLGGCRTPPGMTLEQYERQQRCRTDSPPPDCERR